MHLSYMQLNLTNLKKIEIVISKKSIVICFHLPHKFFIQDFWIFKNVFTIRLKDPLLKLNE